MSRPNVIIITPHDLGDFLGCYGHGVETPHLDALATEGVIFRNHFSTGTVCSPSRGSITTGCYPHTNGLMGLVHRGWALEADDFPPLARLLRGAGYQTLLFGLQHEHYDPRFLGYESIHLPKRGLNVEDVVPLLSDWLATAEATDRPFLAAMGFFDVHRLGQKTPADFRRAAYQSADPAEVDLPPWMPDIPEARQDLADFYGDVSHLDRWMGELVKALERSGLAENTILIFTSDHGASFLHAKATVYDGGTKVPWIIRWPQAIPAGTRIESLSSHVDIVPTLLDLLGLEIPGHVQGLSMAALARGERGEGREYVFAEKNVTNYYDPTRFIRSREFKYIRKGLRTCIFDFLIPEVERGVVQFRDPRAFAFYSSRRCREELYGLCQDPGEMHNVIDDVAYAAVLAELRRGLDAHLEVTDDPFRELHNELLMPETEYGPAMEALWKRGDV